MSEAVTNDQSVLARWAAIHPVDRKAILDRLEPEHRTAFEQLIAEEAADASANRKSEFRGYSTWLARLLSECTADADNPGASGIVTVTPLAKAALVDVHSELRDRPQPQRSAPGLFEYMRSMLRTWGLAA